jgi:uncharacterized peroxidase-related enzyme
MVTLDDELISAIRTDWRSAPLSDRERRMLRYVEKLTLKPYSVVEEDLDDLRDAGMDDREILQVNLICSWFNYINRVADGLGVGRGGSAHASQHAPVAEP